MKLSALFPCFTRIFEASKLLKQYIEYQEEEKSKGIE